MHSDLHTAAINFIENDSCSALTGTNNWNWITLVYEILNLCSLVQYLK